MAARSHLPPEASASSTPTSSAAAPGAAHGRSFAEGAAMNSPRAGSFAAGAAQHTVQAKGRDGLVQLKPAGENLQLLGTPLDEEAPDSEPTPAFGEDKGKQRRFSPDQYVEMWEQEQGRKMTSAERETIDRGCIGITAANLRGGGNPLDAAEKIYGNFEQAEKYMEEKNRVLDWWARIPLIGRLVPKDRYVLFAKLFWSNQSPKWEDRLNPDEDAFIADPETGEMDMSNYKYRAQSKWEDRDGDGEDDMSSYINFDYGFWDTVSKCFWHANHMEYKDPELRARMGPMKVLQSTKAKFVAGYYDFDRIAFGVAKAKNYDAGLAAIAYAGRG